MPRKAWLNDTVKGASLTSFLSDASHETVTALLPGFLILLGAPAYALGLIEGISDGVSSFTKLFSGYYAGRVARRKTFATLGYVASGVFPAVAALATSWPLVLIGRSVGWLGRGLRGPPRDAILAASVPKKDLGKAFGFLRAADTLGAVTGPLIAVLLSGAFNVRQLFWLAVIPALAATFVFWRFVREKPSRPQNQKPFLLTLSRLPKRFKSFTYAVFLFGMSDFSATLLIFYAVTSLTQAMGLAAATATGVLLYTLRNIVYAAASYPAGALGDRFGRKNILAAGYGIAALTFAGFALLPPNLVTFALLFSLAGIFVACEDALEGALTAELVGTKDRTVAYGVLATANGIGDFGSSVIVGTLFSLAGFAWGFGFSAGLALVGTVALLKLE